MFNWNIIGHQNIINFLEQEIINKNLVHAYLFYGPKQIGKKTLAKKFIQSLMCYSAGQREMLPCGKCEHCRQILKNVHPDVFWFKKEASKKDISIEQIRQLQNNLGVHSFFKSYKIAVIEDADQMNLASANALLKTLEEPTLKTILILITEHLNRLPKTIISRSQKIKFSPVANEEIFDYLVNQNIDRHKARDLSNLANGRPGRALILAKSDEIWQAYMSQIDSFFWLLEASRGDKIKFAARFLGSRSNLVEKTAILGPVLNLWQLILRDFILHKLNQSDKIINSSLVNKIANRQDKYSLLDLVKLEKNIDLTKRHLQMNVNVRLALENLLLAIPS